MASGIIGQVYEGYDKETNEKVAVKVRHPKALKILRKDLNLLFDVTTFLSNRSSIFSAIQIPISIDEFTKVLIDQADFRIEAKHLERFRNNF